MKIQYEGNDSLVDALNSGYEQGIMGCILSLSVWAETVNEEKISERVIGKRNKREVELD